MKRSGHRRFGPAQEFDLLGRQPGNAGLGRFRRCFRGSWRLGPARHLQAHVALGAPNFMSFPPHFDAQDIDAARATKFKGDAQDFLGKNRCAPR